MPRTTRRNPPRHRFVAELSVTLGVLLAVAGVFAQGSEDRSHFEVASIRPVDGRAPLSYTGPYSGDPGRIVYSRITLRVLIAGAYPDYGLLGQRISGPMWLEKEYSVAATIPRGSTPKDVDLMLQNLLAERFGLKFHEEIKDVQGFELTIGERGFKLTPSIAKAEPPASNAGAPGSPPRRDRDGALILDGQGTWSAPRDYESGLIRPSFHQCTMKQLAAMLSMNYGEHSVPVTDKTEIKGLFDFHLVLPIPSYAPTVTPQMLSAATRPPDSPDASVADLRGLSSSLEKQTGLRLKPVKLTLPTMVIDSVARTPTEN